MKRDIRWWQVITLVILFAGVVITVWSAQQQDLSMRNDLLIKTSIGETGVYTGHFEALKGSAADIALPEYQALKAHLKKIRAADPDIRFAYLVGQRDDGSILFYADSEPAESADYSPPGQVYEEAPAALRSVFATGVMADEGPYTDRWGTWESGFIPVTDPATGRVIAVFGMDIDAQNWNNAILKSSLPTLIATLLIVLLVLVSAFFQRRSEEEKRRLETSEEKFSKAFHANPALAVVSTIEEGRILDVNTSFLSTLGYSRDEVIGRTTSDLGLYFDPAQRDVIIRQLKETTQVRNMEVRIYRKNRELLVGSLSAIIIDVAGIHRLFTVILDITERKALEQEMECHEQELRRFSASLTVANKKLTILSSITRHDINNQLTVQIGYLTILEGSQPDPTLNEYFQRVSTAAQRISAMIQFTKEYEQIGVNAPLWQEARILVDTAAVDAPLGHVMVKNDLPARMEVFADPLIVKVFYNLMDNASRYGGKITTIRFFMEEHEGDQIIVCEDDGAGVVADEKEKIFERGFGKNTGLGLFLSREILDITGITIRENGEPGKGARFEITVPKGAYRLTGTT